MKIFDCFQYYDEDLLLDFRLNYLNKYVDKFVIVESCYTHSGEKRKLLFNINNFKFFKDKINYIISDKLPDNLLEINKDDSFNQINSKIIRNTISREVLQRNKITDGIKTSEALTQQQNGGNGSQNSMKHDSKDLKDHEQSRSITLPL